MKGTHVLVLQYEQSAMLGGRFLFKKKGTLQISQCVWGSHTPLVSNHLSLLCLGFCYGATPRYQARKAFKHTLKTP